jgi:hypothetical protein
MRKKYITIFFIIFSLLNISVIALIGFSSAKLTDAPVEIEPLKIGERIRNTNYDLNFDIMSKAKSSGLELSSTHTVEDSKLWLSLDDYSGFYFFDIFERWDVGTSETTEIWIQSDRSWLDPDPLGRSYPEITADQVADLLFEFDSNIYPKDTEYFGMPDAHDGSASLLEAWGYVPPGYYHSPEGKNVILVSNVRDENYYTDYPYYIAGFYSPTFEGYFDRNIISIDSYQWEERTGPDGARPYLYEGVIAHEYQHLIHDDYFIESALWMNEGCSMFAEVLCGYPTDWSSINSFLATPDNSLTDWGDQGGINILADYGQVYLWASYLVSNYGNDILKNYLDAGIPGVAGLELLFADQGTNFDAVFHEWIMDNLMRKGYTNIDFDDKEAGDLRVYEVKDKWPTDISGIDFGNTITILDYDTGVSRVGSYGTDYVLLSKLKWQYPSVLYFDGDDHAWTPHWHKDGSAWYSSSSDPLSALDLFLNVDLTGSSVLSFDTMLDIEPYWDFGFVQISTDGGMTWTSLSNEYTTSDDPNGTYPDIVANFPGLTGRSGGWFSMSFDLAGYFGEAIIRFRYMTDWGTQLDGWWVDNVAIDGTPVGDEDFWIDYDPPETSFLVTVLRQDFWDNEYYYNLIAEFDVSGDNQFFLDLADFLSSPGEDLRYPDLVLAITPRVGIADYTFSVIPI